MLERWFPLILGASGQWLRLGGVAFPASRGRAGRRGPPARRRSGGEATTGRNEELRDLAQLYRCLRTKHSSGLEDRWENQLSKDETRGWIAVSATRLQGKGLRKGNVFSQTPVSLRSAPGALRRSRAVPDPRRLERRRETLRNLERAAIPALLARGLACGTGEKC